MVRLLTDFNIWEVLRAPRVTPSQLYPFIAELRSRHLTRCT